MKMSRLTSTNTTTKTAAAKSTQSLLDLAIEAASQGAEKVASQETAEPEAPRHEPSSVTASLTKLAEEVAANNMDSQIARVSKLGSAMGDAFMRRVGDWESVATKLASERTAEANLSPIELQMIHDYRHNKQAFVEKVAAMIPDGPQIPGGDPSDNLTEKQAADLHQKTVETTVQLIHKTAMDHFLEGYRAMAEFLQAAV